MRFAVDGWGRQPKGVLPCVGLQSDNWDDFGHKTLFEASLWLPGGQRIELGAVKILAKGHATTSKVIQTEFSSLSPAQLCSLGQAVDYYEALAKLPEKDRRAILTALCDVVFMDAETAWRVDDDGFDPGLLSTLLAVIDSLLREFKANAIIATHHPFVIQQVPSDAVAVLHRSDDSPVVVRPSFPTFGADLGDLLQFSLGLAEPERDWHDALDEIVATDGANGALRRFQPELGLEAKTYLRSKHGPGTS